ncbi:hypothetical protein JCM3774_000559 [Rhodotorula dairenensis]
MSDTATGECLVCGKAATLRCSRCSQEGGISLFFCSKEHQMLVWPAHKLVCGKNAHPFRVPVFTQEEADTILSWSQAAPTNVWQQEIKRRFDKARQSAGGAGAQASPTTLSSQAAMPFDADLILSPRHRRVQEYLERLVGHGGPMNPPHDSLDHQVLFMRKCDFDYHMPPMPNALLSGSALGSFIATYLAMTARQDQPTDADWYSQFCHRSLCFQELYLSIERPGPNKLTTADDLQSRMELIEQCRTALLRWVKRHGEPALAARIEQCFAAW